MPDIYQNEYPQSPQQPQQKLVNQSAQAGQLSKKIIALKALAESKRNASAAANNQYRQFPTAENYTSALKADIDFHKRSAELGEALLEQHINV